jgi:hypothetical protein
MKFFDKPVYYTSGDGPGGSMSSGAASAANAAAAAGGTAGVGAGSNASANGIGSGGTSGMGAGGNMSSGQASLANAVAAYNARTGQVGTVGEGGGDAGGDGSGSGLASATDKDGRNEATIKADNDFATFFNPVSKALFNLLGMKNAPSWDSVVNTVNDLGKPVANWGDNDSNKNADGTAKSPSLVSRVQSLLSAPAPGPVSADGNMKSGQASLANAVAESNARTGQRGTVGEGGGDFGGDSPNHGIAFEGHRTKNNKLGQSEAQIKASNDFAPFFNALTNVAGVDVNWGDVNNFAALTDRGKAARDAQDSQNKAAFDKAGQPSGTTEPRKKKDKEEEDIITKVNKMLKKNQPTAKPEGGK